MIAACLIWLAGLPVYAQKTKKILIIGMDGCRWDALVAADAPVMDSIIGASVYSFDGLTETATWSAVGWSGMLTGVWRNKHGVYNNDFIGRNYTQYPSFIDRIETLTPQKNTTSICSWSSINDYIFSKPDKKYNVSFDWEVKNKTVDELTNSNADVLFADFTNIDTQGHLFGFSPAVPQYVDAISTTDKYVVEIMQALKNRPSYKNEDWLVILTTDHGGLPGGHGESSLEERNIFSVFSNPSFVPKKIVKDSFPLYMNNSYLQFRQGVYVKSQSASPYRFGATGDFTIECLVKLKPDLPGDPCILSNKNWSIGYNKGFVFAVVRGNRWKINIGDGSSRIDFLGGKIVDDKWHHIAVTFDRDSLMTMYEDGTRIGSVSIKTIGDINTNFPLVIGQDGTLKYNYSIKGYVSEVRVWNKVLDQQEIQNWITKPVDNTHPSYSNLITYYKGSEGTGTQWYDSSPVKNDATTSSAPVWEYSSRGNWFASLVFGNTNYAKPANSALYQFDMNQDFTIECKVKANAWKGDPVIISDKNWNSGLNKGYIITADANGFWKVNIGDGKNRTDARGGFIADGQWHQLAFTCKRGGQVFLYQDGEKISAASMSRITEGIASGLPFVIGQDGTTAYPYWFPGNIADIRIWNTVLSEENINAWKNKTITSAHPNYANLIGYWPADEGTGNIFTDKSKSYNNAEVTGRFKWQPAYSYKDISTLYNYNNTPRQVDMAVSCLDFLGYTINPEWGLDGKSWIPKSTIANAAANVISNEGTVVPFSFTVSPNPAQDKIVLSISSSVYGNASLDLLGSNGMQVFSKDILLNKGNQKVQLVLPPLSNGIYFMRLKTSGTEEIKQLFIQR